MEKVIVTLDVSKIDKSRIVENKFTTKDGQEVTQKNYDIEVVPLKPENVKTISTGQGWELKKTHFVVQGQTKEEREARADSVFVGSGKMFVSTGNGQGEEDGFNDSSPF